MSDAVISTRRTVPTWYAATLGILFGLVYAYVVWQAIASLVIGASGALGLNVMGWLVWVMAAVVPVIAFGAAFVIGRRRGMLGYALVLFAGLGVVAVFWLNILSYTTMNAGSLLG